jgi:tetratricopeptide (TPR) repeat protein
MKIVYVKSLAIILAIAAVAAVLLGAQFDQDDSQWNSQHDAFLPFTIHADPNESSPEIAAAYLQSRELIVAGDWAQARTVLEGALTRFPESRHLHKQLAQLLWYFYNDVTNDRSTLDQAIEEATRAVRIGFSFGEVDHHLTDLLARALGQTNDVETLDRLFTEALAIDSSSRVYLDYAHGLSLMDNPRTADVFRKAIEQEPQGTVSALTEFSEWLLDRGRQSEVVDLLARAPNPYLRFLRGVALEQLGRLEEARQEYARFKEHSISSPAPRRFKIPDSPIQSQSGIKFIGDDRINILNNSGSDRAIITAAVISTQTIQGLSYLIYGEAGNETIGGMRAVGWIVRSRALRGSVGSPACPYVENSGFALADQYKSVMCQGSGNQFNGMCLAWCANPDTTSCSSNTHTNSVANGVYNGYAPDPVAKHCPGGITSWGGSYCADGTTCRGLTRTYRLAGPLFNFGTGVSCPSPHPGTTSCTPRPLGRGKTCSNGGLDNCFYTNPIYNIGIGTPVNYSGSLSGTGASKYSTPFYSSVSGTHYAHLEGPESIANQDFGLDLQKGDSSNGPWQPVASSTRLASIEDITYQGTISHYRWHVYSNSGGGSFRLYTKRP